MQKFWKRLNFYPRPPRGGRHHAIVYDIPFTKISIHALREEGDTSRLPQTYTEYIFLSTPSARRATQSAAGCRIAGAISIHALREEGDKYCRPTRRKSTYFYPRPPRGGRPSRLPQTYTEYIFLSTPSARRATALIRPLHTASRFLSTPSARRATQSGEPSCLRRWISIHALREEGDMNTRRMLTGCGWISIHALREEGDTLWRSRGAGAL